jgi:hypothetical protein
LKFVISQVSESRPGAPGEQAVLARLAKKQGIGKRE